MLLALLFLVALAAIGALAATPYATVGHARTARFLIRPTDLDAIPHLVRRSLDPVTVATELLAKHHARDQLVVQNTYTDAHNGVTHVHFMQVVNGTEVTNGIAHVAVDKSNRVVSFSDLFASPSAVAALTPRLSIRPAATAVRDLGAHLALPTAAHTNWTTAADKKDPAVTWVHGVSFAADKIWTKPRLYVADNGDLAWVVDVRLHTPATWVNAQVSNAGNGVVGFVDWSADAVYRAFPAVGFASDPTEGDMALVGDPEDTAVASPQGWVGTDGLTVGNNVVARQSPKAAALAGHAPLVAKGASTTAFSATPALAFDFPADLRDGRPTDHLATSLTNAFYVVNLMHDLLYRFGFTETAGNFQTSNLGRGGLENDAVIVHVHDPSQRNNANFATPPDGVPPTLTAFLFDMSGTTTDPVVDDSILMHEVTHGLVSRLTGGPANPNCLSTPESRAMNEGWADAFAAAFKARATYADATIGSFNSGKPNGLRRFPYSTSTTTNPLTYKDATPNGEPHAVGEVWAQILWETLWAGAATHGFQANWRLTPGFRDGVNLTATALGGNVQVVQDWVDGMKLQACNPTMRQARDAILLADQINFDGQNRCDLWRAFAKRGLGVNAGTLGEADFTVPPQCTLGKRMVRF
ncbi:hypothetical protein AMAG_00149 [Allomyces macrogynus ATCC 38327]|uniref:Extracellular metalloproteinase n=1 Tax=Allomyces macrogynus (strain ATCC 38327) TaxID=578462 RepID=A0A0L0RVP4_ALLM3|nr:hypothetical protein AMAG_00149 [Allomyces macrogynus ATCC 38327]|eukprot:KNE54151.1 hypothetical protein AMAG_00149 [Allomyces macrogynus ATCC 38327]